LSRIIINDFKTFPMSKSDFTTVQDLLDNGNNQFLANVLRAEIVELARNFFLTTDDYIDIEDCVYNKKIEQPTMKFTHYVKVCGATKFKFTFSIDYTERDEDVHTCRLHLIEFDLNGSKFDLTEILRKEFTDHIQSTGIRFAVTVSRK